MASNINLYINIFIFTVFISFAYHILYNESKFNLNLGLDLQGGSSILMEIDYKELNKELITKELDTMAELVKLSSGVDIDDDTFAIEKKPTVDPVEFDSKIQEIFKASFLKSEQISKTENKAIFRLKKSYLKDFKLNIINDSLNRIRKRIDSLGVQEISIRSQGQNTILVEIPGIDDPSDIKKIIGKTAKLSFYIVENQGGGRPRIFSKKIKDEYNNEYWVNKNPDIDGSFLTEASVTYDANNRPIVAFSFNSTGSRKLAAMTKSNIGKRMAIALDDVVIMSPVIKDSIAGGRGTISGNFDLKTANNLAIMLRSGSLPAPLSIIEQRIIGPTLGSDSVSKGIKSIIIAFIFTMLIMLSIYKVFGIISSIALIMTLSIIVCTIGIMGITLTLPGIAGIVLTIGMSVDANVLIYERIKEEIKENKESKKLKSHLKTIADSFDRAFITILDSNLTTIIAGIVMFAFGDGPIRGFAITLCIGVISSFFTSFGILKISILEISKRKNLYKSLCEEI